LDAEGSKLYATIDLMRNCSLHKNNWEQRRTVSKIANVLGPVDRVVFLSSDDLLRIFMDKLKFERVSAKDDNRKWAQLIERKEPIYRRKDDIRTDFERDYTRILHSTAYRRLKHKT
jgi:hypothetical protein